MLPSWRLVFHSKFEITILYETIRSVAVTEQMVMASGWELKGHEYKPLQDMI